MEFLKIGVDEYIIESGLLKPDRNDIGSEKQILRGTI